MQIYTGFAAKRRLIISSNPANSKNFPEYSKYCVYISGLLQKTSQKLSHCHITLIFTPNNHKQRLDFFLDHQCAAAWLPFKLFAASFRIPKNYIVISIPYPFLFLVFLSLSLSHFATSIPHLCLSSQHILHFLSSPSSQ
jgi:hypothetical protein